MGRRLLTSAVLLALGLAAGFTIAQAGSAVALAPQQARPASHSDAPGLDEFIPQGAFVRVAEETQRALVFIRTEQMVSDSESLMEQFRRFFGEENVPDQPEARIQQSSGSGFLVSADGHIVTNAHVVSQTDVNAHEVKVAETVTVYLNNDDEYEAEVVGVDIGTDLAVLKINAGTDLPFVPMGDSDQSKVGEWVMALGAPFGLTNTVSAGIISAKGRAQVGGTAGSTYQDFIQTDAQINPGNSGGPLVNLRGEVIGINTMILSDRISGQFSGVGFAIPVNLVRGVVDQLIEHGRVIRGWLGISMRPLDPDLADAYGLDRRAMRGAVEISTVNVGEPADTAGIQAGDIVVATDGSDLDSDQDFLQRIAMTPPDASISLDIVRMVPDDTPVGLTHESQSISVMLGERPPEIDVLADQNQGSGFTGFSRRPNLEEHEMTPLEERFGILLSDLEPNLASELEYRTSDGGVVVLGVLRNSIVADQGLLGFIVEGTIIRRINMRPVNSIADFEELIDRFEPGDTAIFDLREPGDIAVRVVVEIPQ